MKQFRARDILSTALNDTIMTDMQEIKDFYGVSSDTQAMRIAIHRTAEDIRRHKGVRV